MDLPGIPICVYKLTDVNQSISRSEILRTGFGQSSHNGHIGEFGIQTVLKNNWNLTISYYHMQMDAKDVPANYYPGSLSIPLFDFSTNGPS